MATTGQLTGLEQELNTLLDVERFEPAAEFKEAALWSDPAIYEEAAADPAGLVAAAGHRAPRLGGAAERIARRLRPAVLQVVRRRQAERVGELPRPPRRGGARRPGRLLLAGRGGGGARDHLRRPPRRRAALRQCAARPRHRQGRRRRHLPADDPRGRRRDARLRPDRRPAQRRLRWLRRRGRARADGVLRGEGAGHGRRRPPQRQDRAGQAEGRRGDRRRRLDRDDLRRPQHRHRVRDAGGSRRLGRRGDGRRGRRVPGRADGGRAPALHPLHLGLDREAEGDPPHHRRLHGRLSPTPTATSST